MEIIDLALPTRSRRSVSWEDVLPEGVKPEHVEIHPRGNLEREREVKPFETVVLLGTKSACRLSRKEKVHEAMKAYLEQKPGEKVRKVVILTKNGRTAQNKLRMKAEIYSVLPSQ